MGGEKPLRCLGGVRLIDHAVRLARRFSDDVRVSVRDRCQISDLDTPLLIDDVSLAGPLAGLQSALVAAVEARHRSVLAIPCDAPFLPSDLAARLGAASAPAVLAADRARLQPACSWWAVEILHEMTAYLATGRRSLLGFAEAVGYVAVRWSDEHFVNVNTIDELVQAERRLASEVENLNERTGFQRDAPGP